MLGLLDGSQVLGPVCYFWVAWHNFTITEQTPNTQIGFLQGFINVPRLTVVRELESLGEGRKLRRTAVLEAE